MTSSFSFAALTATKGLLRPAVAEALIIGVAGDEPVCYGNFSNCYLWYLGSAPHTCFITVDRQLTT